MALHFFWYFLHFFLFFFLASDVHEVTPVAGQYASFRAALEQYFTDFLSVHAAGGTAGAGDDGGGDSVLHSDA